MIGWRVLQAIAFLALLACLDLATKATPLRGDILNMGRLLYAGSGMVTALTLFALAALGIGQAKLRAQLARIEELLSRRE